MLVIPVLWAFFAVWLFKTSVMLVASIGGRFIWLRDPITGATIINVPIALLSAGISIWLATISFYFVYEEVTLVSAKSVLATLTSLVIGIFTLLYASTLAPVVWALSFLVAFATGPGIMGLAILRGFALITARGVLFILDALAASLGIIGLAYFIFDIIIDIVGIHFRHDDIVQKRNLWQSSARPEETWEHWSPNAHNPTSHPRSAPASSARRRAGRSNRRS